MAVSFGKTEAYTILNEVVKEAMGTEDIAVVDTTSFVKTGEALMRNPGYEKTLNAISNVFFRTIFSVRPYEGKLKMLIDEENGLWGDAERKLVPLFKYLEKSTDNNTDSAIAAGEAVLVNGEWVNPWIINKPELVQTCFIGSDTIQKSITNFTEDQLNVAFSSEGEFISFLQMMATAWTNEIEKTLEEKRRLTLANYIAGCIKNNMAIDVVEEFNRVNDSDFTLDELLSTYFENFSKFTIALIKKKSEIFTEYTTTEHINLDDYAPIPRHTSKENQRLAFYEPFFIDMKANVFSSIFHPEELKIGDYEKINFWQSINDPTAIKIKPNYMDTDGEVKDATEAVEQGYILGVLFDKDALRIRNIYQRTLTTPLNEAGLYSNTFYHSQFAPKVDYTEKGVVFYLGAGGTNPNTNANSNGDSNGDVTEG